MKKTISFYWNSIKKLLLVYPLQIFVLLISITILLIVVGNVLREPKNERVVKKPSPKKVSIYSIGKAPRIMLQAKIEKSGVIKIAAQTAGVVQHIYKKEGDRIYRGQWIVGLSTNYQGVSAPSLTREIAQRNYTFVEESYQTQKDILAKNRELAEKAENFSTDTREITSRSIDETKSLISLNENVISMMDEQLKYLESINVNGSSNSAILQVKTGKISALAGLNQAKASLRNIEYQTGSDNEPAQMARIQKEIALKQLEIQEKTIDLNKELSRLNLRLAQIQESLMYPSSPFEGTIERIFVQPGQQISPGMPIASIVSSKQSVKATASLSKGLAKSVSQLEPSVFYIGEKSLSLYPAFISTEPTSGTLHTITYHIPEEYTSQFTHEEYVKVKVPIGNAQTMSADPYIPIDSLYQTQNQSYVFVLVQKDDGKAYVKTKEIEVGLVQGSYIQVLSGLKENDQIILDRTVSDGEQVAIAD